MKRWLPFLLLAASLGASLLAAPGEGSDAVGARPGDQAYYSVTGFNAEGRPVASTPVDALFVSWRGLEGQTAVVFQFLADDPRTSRPVEVIRQHLPGGPTSTVSYDPDTGEVQRTVRFEGSPVPCGFVPEDAAKGDGCEGAGSSLGRASVQGQPADRYHTPSGHDIWMLDGLPVPVRIEGEFVGLLGAAGPGASSHRFDLLGFRSDGDLPGWSPDFPRLVGAARTAPTQVWGPAEGGIEHPFPLSEAVAFATTRQEANLELIPFGADQDAFAAFFARNDTYLAEAHGTKVTQGSSTAWIWHLIATDGLQIEERFVRYGAPSAAGVQLPGDGTAEVAARSDLPFAAPLPAGLYPRADRLPTEMPVVSSAMARFIEVEARFLSAAPPESYGFQVGCTDSSCIEVSTAISVGVHAVTTTLDGASDEVEFLLWFDAEGNPVRIVESAEADPGTPAVAAFETRPDPVHSGLLEWAPSQAQLIGAGLGALALAALYAAWPAIKSSFAVGLFSRIRDDELLEDPLRRDLFEIIRAEPGVHAAEMQRRLGVSRGAVRYHLRRLQEGNLVLVRRHGNERCHFVRADGVTHIDATVAVRSDGARSVLQAVAAIPNASQSQLAEEAGLALSTVNHHLSSLESSGWIARRRVGRRKVAELTEAGRKRLAELSDQRSRTSYSRPGGVDA